MVSIDLRKTILKMHSQGYKVTLISRILDMPNSTVWNIIRKFQTTKEVADLPRTVCILDDLFEANLRLPLLFGIF